MRKKTKEVRSLDRNERICGYIFIAAPLIQFFVFVLGPLLFSLGASFTDWSLLKSGNFIGLGNFSDIIKDETFWKASFNTVFLMIGIPIGMFLSLLLAIAMNRKIKGIKVFRVIYYLPVISSAVAIAILWKWIYNSDYGILNTLLWMLFKVKGPNWLGSATWIKPALIIMGVWKSLGVGMILYLAGLQNISESYYEAVDMDGGNALHKFRYITLPLITPISFFIVITSIIGSLQSFSETYIMTTNGGPEYAAGTVVYYLWQKGFSSYQMGYACAVSWILTITILIITIVQFKLSDKWVYEGN
jgi:multiple sugar transport system permease protein